MERKGLFPATPFYNQGASPTYTTYLYIYNQSEYIHAYFSLKGHEGGASFRILDKSIFTYVTCQLLQYFMNVCLI